MTKPLKMTNEENITGNFHLELKHYCFQIARGEDDAVVDMFLEFMRIGSFLPQLSYGQFAVHNSAMLPQIFRFFFNISKSHLQVYVCLH